jgi:hypothetical protein
MSGIGSGTKAAGEGAAETGASPAAGGASTTDRVNSTGAGAADLDAALPADARPSNTAACTVSDRAAAAATPLASRRRLPAAGFALPAASGALTRRPPVTVP